VINNSREGFKGTIRDIMVFGVTLECDVKTKSFKTSEILASNSRRRAFARNNEILLIYFQVVTNGSLFIEVLRPIQGPTSSNDIEIFGLTA
jgi:hypothetical protein